MPDHDHHVRPDSAPQPPCPYGEDESCAYHSHPESAPQPEETHVLLPRGELLCGGGCGKRYVDFPLDVHLPDDQWKLINGKHGGVLCASCIVERASGIPGVTVVNACIDIPSNDPRFLEIVREAIAQPVRDAEPEHRPMTMEITMETRIEAAVNRIVSDFAERNIDVHREYFIAILTEYLAHPPSPPEPMAMEREISEAAAEIAWAFESGANFNVSAILRKHLTAHPPAVTQPKEQSEDFERRIAMHATGDCCCYDPDECNRKLVKLAREILAPSSAVAQPDEYGSCGICGGKQISIRGRHPKDDRRIVCPTCLADRLDIIREYSARDYGVAYTERASSSAVAPNKEKG